MTTTSDPARMTSAQSVVVLRPRTARLTVPLDAPSPRAAAHERNGTVRALTAALAPHLSMADPELHGLASTLLSAQQGYATNTSGVLDVDRDELRRRYLTAALDYCAALDRRGSPAPPGLLEAVRWLADPVGGAPVAPPASENEDRAAAIRGRRKGDR